MYHIEQEPFRTETVSDRNHLGQEPYRTNLFRTLAKEKSWQHKNREDTDLQNITWKPGLKKRLSHAKMATHTRTLVSLSHYHLLIVSDFFVCRFPGDGFFSEERDEERPDAFRRMDIADLRNVVFSYIPVGASVRCAQPSFLGSRTPPPHPSPPCPPAHIFI
jgi:hypothetical protein